MKLELGFGTKCGALLIWSLVSCSLLAAEADQTWRLGWSNDGYLGSDNQFTNGVSLQINSARTAHLEQTRGTPVIGKSLANWLLPQRDDLVYRESWTLGHNMQTPDNLSESQPIFDDVPYVGMIGIANSFIAFNNEELTGFQLLYGWTGPSTLAEQAQIAAHQLTGANRPEGWSNQLDTEPLINFYIARKKKFFSNENMDFAWALDGALGNFFSFGQAAIEWRFGRRPGGFATETAPVGRQLDFDPRLSDPTRTYLYGSAKLRVTQLLFALPREGNLLRRGNEWTNNRQIEPERSLVQLVLGLHIEQRRWRTHIELVLTSSTVKVDSGPGLSEPNNNFVVLSLERVF